MYLESLSLQFITVVYFHYIFFNFLNQSFLFFCSKVSILGLSLSLTVLHQGIIKKTLFSSLLFEIHNLMCRNSSNLGLISQPETLLYLVIRDKKGFGFFFQKKIFCKTNRIWLINTLFPGEQTESYSFLSDSNTYYCHLMWLWQLRLLESCGYTNASVVNSTCCFFFFSEDLGLFLSTHMMSYKPSMIPISWGLIPSVVPGLYVMHIHMQAKYSLR